MTDMEEQRMIEQAKAGDPRAQFELSQWARQMSILEPNEERWNRVAAKALVDSAQAGYEPAKAMMQALISGQTADKEPSAEEEISFGEPEESVGDGGNFSGSFDDALAASSSFYDQAQEEDYFDDEELDDMIDYEQNGERAGVGAVVKKLGGGLAALVGGLAGRAKKKKEYPEEESEEAEETELAPEEAEEGEADEEPVSRRNTQRSGGGFMDFIEENWGVVKIVCIAICVVLVALIVLLCLPGGKTEEAAATPMPTSVPATPEPTPEPFPNEATLLEIRSTATLQYRPADSEYLSAALTLTVTAEGAENLRQGPGAGDYPDVVMQIPQGTQVTAYAQHTTADTDESGNPISWYLLNSGGTWGWMYGPSLSMG